MLRISCVTIGATTQVGPWHYENELFDDYNGSASNTWL